MLIYVVVTSFQGCISEVQAFRNEPAAGIALEDARGELGIEAGGEAESENDAKLFECEV